MSIWGVEGEDSFEMTAPPDSFTFSGTDESESPNGGAGEDFENFGDAPRRWTPEYGFPEGKGIVRIWLDDDELISKVRISPSWYEKLKSEERLEDCFGRCFHLINNRQGASGQLGKDRFSIELPRPEAPTELMSREKVSQIREDMRQILEEMRTLGPEAHGKWVGDGAVGLAAKGAVKLYLNNQGELSRVKFDDKWLDEARVRTIGEAVISAHRDARAKYRPAEYEPGQADILAAQLNGCRKKLYDMFFSGISLK